MPTRDSLNEQDLEALEDHLADLETCLLEGDLEGAEQSLASASELAGDDDVDVGYGRALVAWERDDLEGAARALRVVLEQDPSFGDAHHTLALVLAELGDEAGKLHHFLRARELDEVQERELGVPTSDDVDHIGKVAQEVIDGLPDEFARKLRSVPVILESRPSRDLIEDGLDPRAFGLFDGSPEGQDAPTPTRIVLYTGNLLAAFTPEELEDQVEVTILHEVGHYFGLGEDDLTRLGLD